MSTVRRFILNVGSSWLAMLVRIGSNFLLYPYVIYKTSDASCGVWRTAMSFLVCTALLDFGLGMAIRRYAARFAALKSGEDQQRLMSTATVFYAAGGLLVMLVLFAVAPFSPTFFKDIPPELGDQTRQLFFLVGIVAFLRLMTTPFMAFLQGLQHITTYNLANIASNVLRITATGLSYVAFTDKSTIEFLHDLHGWLMMPVGLALLGLEVWVLKRLVLDTTDPVNLRTAVHGV